MAILNIAGVVALITGSLSLIGIIIGLVYNYRENRTNRYVEIITKQTLENFMFVRENSEIIMTYTRPEIIDAVRGISIHEYKIKLMKAEVNIEHHFKYVFPNEQKMIEVLRNLIKCAFEYYDNPSEKLNQKLRALGNNFYEKITVYDYADWLYIKSQAKSKAVNKQFKDFDEIYKLQQENFKKGQKPKPW